MIKPDDVTLIKIAPIIQERVATPDELPEIAGFFFRSFEDPKVEDLISIGLTASQFADVARKSLAVLEAAPEMTTEAAEPPMRALVEELGLLWAGLWNPAHSRYRVRAQSAAAC